MSRAASMALWAYMGVESATVSAGVIENPKRNVPLATLMGLGAAAVIYVLSSTVIMGMLPNEELQHFARAVRRSRTHRGRHLGSGDHQRLRGAEIRRIARRLDAAGRPVGQGGGRRRHVSADLRAHQSPRRAGRRPHHRLGADDGGAVRHHVADAGQQFNRIVDLAVILIIVPYVYASVADAEGAPRPRGVAQDFRDVQAASRSSPLPIACGPSSAAIPRPWCTHWWRC